MDDKDDISTEEAVKEVTSDIPVEGKGISPGVVSTALSNKGIAL